MAPRWLSGGLAFVVEIVYTVMTELFGMKLAFHRQFVPVIIIIAVLLVAGGGIFFAYRTYGGDIAFYAYQQSAGRLSGFEAKKTYIRDAFRAIHANPKDAQNYVDLGSAQYGIQDYRGAESSYLRALARAPYASVIFWNISHLYIQTKEYDKAEQYAKLAIERLPDKPLGYESLGELYTYYIPAKQSELPSLYKQAFEKTGDSIFLLLQAGYYRDHNEASKAIAAYQTWLARNPKEQNRKAVEAEIKQLGGRIE